MHIVFMGARLPLTKSFVYNNGTYTASPYPHVSKVTSYHKEANTLAAFRDLLVEHAAANHCLFNGQLTRPLKNETRAGMTKASKRDWIVFDFDKVQASSAEEVISTYLPAECQNVSYIVQLSASMFRPDNNKWSGHIYMLLRQPIEQTQLRQWFEYLNFSVPALTDSLELSDSLEALRWPLDRTVAYDSKLIYIAAPRCHGFKPALSQHISLVRKRQEKLSIGSFNPIDNQTIRQKINELRRKIGEAEVDYDLVKFEGQEMLRNAQPGVIQNIKTSGDHYIRFNLNGGDSYAYFIDLRNPEVIRNFKGEPYMQTKQVDESLYKSLRRAARQATSKPPLNDGTEVLAFYATNQGSPIKIGLFDPVDRRVTLNSASETAARAWRAEYGLTQKEYLPHYNLEFNPTMDVQFMEGMTTINTFRTTDYMARERNSMTPSTLDELPPLTNKVVRSILGDPEERVVKHFINWVAYIFQYRKKAGTAWVLNGIEGSGKGTFIKYFMQPLLGPEHVAVIQYANLEREYNEFLENALLVVVEEADIKSVGNAEQIMAKIKLWISDDNLPIRKMRSDVYTARTYCNFILNTNTRTPAAITGTDRRFNFGERQNKRWIPTPNELTTLFEGKELDAFADVLQRWPVNEFDAAMVIDTEAKRDAHEATTSINQQVADAVIQGDLQFFIDRMPTDVEAAADFSNGRFPVIGLYRTKIDEYVEAATSGKQVLVKDEDLFVMFRMLIPDPRYFQDSVTWRRRHYKSLGLDVSKQHRVPGTRGDRDRGILVSWQLPDGYEHPEADEKVTPINKGKKR